MQVCVFLVFRNQAKCATNTHFFMCVSILVSLETHMFTTKFFFLMYTHRVLLVKTKEHKSCCLQMQDQDSLTRRGFNNAARLQCVKTFQSKKSSQFHLPLSPASLLASPLQAEKPFSNKPLPEHIGTGEGISSRAWLDCNLLGHSLLTKQANAQFLQHIRTMFLDHLWQSTCQRNWAWLSIELRALQPVNRCSLGS